MYCMCKYVLISRLRSTSTRYVYMYCTSNLLALGDLNGNRASQVVLLLYVQYTYIHYIRTARILYYPWEQD